MPKMTPETRLVAHRTLLVADIERVEADIQMITEYQAMLMRTQRRRAASEYPEIRAMGEKQRRNDEKCIEWSGKASTTLARWIESVQRELESDLPAIDRCRRRLRSIYRTHSLEAFRESLDFMREMAPRIATSDQKIRRLKAMDAFLTKTRDEIYNADYMALDEAEKH